MDPFPVSKYVNKKMLANLSEMMEKDLSFPKDQVYGNLLDGLKLNGSLYYMPMSFYMDFLWKTNYSALVDEVNRKADFESGLLPVCFSG